MDDTDDERVVVSKQHVMKKTPKGARGKAKAKPKNRVNMNLDTGNVDIVETDGVDDLGPFRSMIPQTNNSKSATTKKRGKAPALAKDVALEAVGKLSGAAINKLKDNARQGTSTRQQYGSP